jgi:hypothetical protein
MESSYWKVRYGPEPFEEEAECVAGIMKHALKRCKLQGFLQDAEVFIVKSVVPSNASADDWTDVVALVKLVDSKPEAMLRTRLSEVCLKHKELFANECTYTPLLEAEYDQLTAEYGDAGCSYDKV